MKILALEFSSSQRSVAVLNPESGAVAEVVETAVGHTMKPFGMIEAALRELGLEREQIECIAVGLGPGSYTGVRAAIAVAQGWQLARAVQLVGVGSADCVAADAAAAGVTGPIHVVMDAQRGEIYVAGYELAAGCAREVSPLRIVTAETMRMHEQRGDVLMGPEVGKWFPGGRPMFPQAARLARLAAERGNSVRGDQLEPIYLRETTFVKAPPPREFPS
jgi:tRNA threonylcarbamoyl adenosine modification protein YeaZ